jgi:hypothetical protein
MDISSEAVPLPLSDLIAELKDCGFDVGVERQLRLFRLLGSLNGQCEPEQLKFLLCPIFAIDEKQQTEFYRIFEAQYFDPPKPLKPPKPPVPKTRSTYTKVIRGRIRGFLPLIAVLAVHRFGDVCSELFSFDWIDYVADTRSDTADADRHISEKCDGITSAKHRRANRRKLDHAEMDISGFGAGRFCNLRDDLLSETKSIGWASAVCEATVSVAAQSSCS